MSSLPGGVYAAAQPERLRGPARHPHVRCHPLLPTKIAATLGVPSATRSLRCGLSLFSCGCGSGSVRGTARSAPAWPTVARVPDAALASPPKNDGGSAPCPRGWAHVPLTDPLPRRSRRDSSIRLAGGMVGDEPDVWRGERPRSPPKAGERAPEAERRAATVGRTERSGECAA